jgi:hypothetical protein
MLISGLQRTSAAAVRVSGSWQVPWARGPNPQFPFPRFPIWPGIGEGTPDSRFGQNRETGNPRFPVRRESGNREPPFPDSAGTGNRGPDGGGPGISWSESAHSSLRLRLLLVFQPSELAVPVAVPVVWNLSGYFRVVNNGHASSCRCPCHSALSQAVTVTRCPVPAGPGPSRRLLLTMGVHMGANRPPFNLKGGSRAVWVVPSLKLLPSPPKKSY